MQFFSALFAHFMLAVAQPTSITDFAEYNNFCMQAAKDPAVFAHFRSQSIYVTVLDHVTYSQGEAFLEAVKRKAPEFLQKMEVFKGNDRFGSPHIYPYPGIGLISPTTLRYIHVAAHLKQLFGSELEQASIIEIGGGFGGQCKILADVCSFKSYTIVDLPGPIALTKKFIEAQNVPNVHFKTFDESILDQSFDLIVSNYAYTECAPEMQEKYCREILSRSKRGYLICTQAPGSVAPLKEESLARFDRYQIPYEVLPEEPSTNPLNYLVIWRASKR